jgi:predicted nucleic acid-binding protein
MASPFLVSLWCQRDTREVSEATILVRSDEDLLCLHPWNGVDILRRAEFIVR